MITNTVCYILMIHFAVNALVIFDWAKTRAPWLRNTSQFIGLAQYLIASVVLCDTMHLPLFVVVAVIGLVYLGAWLLFPKPRMSYELE